MLDGVYRRTGGDTGLSGSACARPAIAHERLREDGTGNVLLQLKSPWRDGTTYLRMTPLARFG